jgi:hypothetical protein
MATDAVGLSPLVAGLSWTTSLGNNFTVGEPPDLGLPDVRSSSGAGIAACDGGPGAECGPSSGTASKISAASSALAEDILAHAKAADNSGNAQLLRQSQQPEETYRTSPSRQLHGTSSSVGTEEGTNALVSGGSQAVSVAAVSVSEDSAEPPAATAVWMPSLELSKRELGTGVVVGVAAFSSGDAIHALGMLFLDQPTKSEL